MYGVTWSQVFNVENLDGKGLVGVMLPVLCFVIVFAMVTYKE